MEEMRKAQNSVTSLEKGSLCTGGTFGILIEDAHGV